MFTLLARGRASSSAVRSSLNATRTVRVSLRGQLVYGRGTDAIVANHGRETDAVTQEQLAASG